MSAQLNRKTPTINVADSRGLTVRQVAYWRNDAAKAAQTRITRQQYDTTGRQVAQWDPRLFDKTPKANLTTVYSLSGKPLLVDSVDAGWRLNLPGDAGQTLRSWDQRGSHWQTTYDNQLRPTEIQEQASDQKLRMVERFLYGDSSSTSAASNLCGALTRHDDSAGTLLINEYALCAKPVSQTRRFLFDPEQPHWPTEEKDRDVLLEKGDGHKTIWRYDALGEPIQQIDAGEHRQHFSFDVAGQLKAVSLKIKGAETEKTMVKDLAYNAFGQVESQTAGNDVISRAVFDPASGRLTSLTASVSGSTLQTLHYTYDAVGNVTKIEDKAQPVQFGSNQKVEAVSTFTYDTLYQLTSATGREAAGPNSQPQLPTSSRTPIDARQLFNFAEHYEYDVGGNLTELRHVRDRNNYTRTLNIACASNRLLSWNQGDSTPDAAATFDANGNLQALQPGQSLQWNAHNQLAGVVLVKREDGRNDNERYYYDSGGQRVRKIQTTYAASVTHTREVRYLPGVEIRTRNNERLEVITLQAGRCSVRYLHWTEGQPSGIPAAGQLRYSLDDHLGSSSLELDDQAWLISQESYLPYGGTAWTASRSAVEADYKTIRYSGKERDASGLYYYGHRYYAPWLQRWISPDPAGTVDGLNLYCMVGNNPLRYTDQHGNNKEEFNIKKEIATYPNILSEVHNRVDILNYQLYNSIDKKGIVKRLFQHYTYNATKNAASLAAGLAAAPSMLGAAGAATAISLTFDSIANKFDATRHLSASIYPQVTELSPKDIEKSARATLDNPKGKFKKFKKDIDPRNNKTQKNLSTAATNTFMAFVGGVRGAWTPNFEASTQATKALNGIPAQKLERLNNALLVLDEHLEHDSNAINAAFDTLGVEEFYANGVKGHLNQAQDLITNNVGNADSNTLSRTKIQLEITKTRATIQRGRELLFRLNEHNKSLGR
ncbi:RHS repeat-associated core domain-containing protein [Pseudomonas sp. H3(2019)]|uniref:RHS repeat-associated core domain-containing protein n=1 Tax=Pseudomonas sp. H3(2019) TaxID=2598724 RepID=UPI00118EDC00|nr:RHS repeat-associated core domain-containing protein [Pseudomonas sp. H3(2019)]TVT84558.1 RHS repeat-associated core domain-containing protein [Pseudomonas sp. H3(2019)]